MESPSLSKPQFRFAGRAEQELRVALLRVRRQLHLQYRALSIFVALGTYLMGLFVWTARLFASVGRDRPASDLTLMHLVTGLIAVPFFKLGNLCFKAAYFGNELRLSLKAAECKRLRAENGLVHLSDNIAELIEIANRYRASCESYKAI
jgi:hypothetical protein